MDNIWPIVITIIIIYFFIRAARLAPDNSCFAVIKIGKFEGFKGPGYHLKWSGSETEWIKLEIGERGKATSNDLAKFQETQLPIESKEKIKIGTFVRITGFTDNTIEVIKDEDQSTSFICEKCGHENPIN